MNNKKETIQSITDDFKALILKHKTILIIKQKL